jgi:hypothetical protein
MLGGVIDPAQAYGEISDRRGKKQRENEGGKS